LPQDKIKGIDVPLVLAFKYVRHPFDINIDIKKHEDVSVLVAIVESAQITSVLTKEGQVIVDTVYKIKNRQKQHLKVTLPKNATIWSTFVNNKPIKAGKSKEGHILIPLEKSQDKEMMFPVEIIYETKRPELKLFGKLKMTQPKLDIPMTNVFWRLYLPDEYTYTGFGGNLKIAKAKQIHARLERGRIAQSSPFRRNLDGKKESTDYRYKVKAMEESLREISDLEREEQQVSVRKDMDFIKNIKTQVQIYQQRMEPKLRRITKGKQMGVLPIKVAIPNWRKIIHL